MDVGGNVMYDKNAQGGKRAIGIRIKGTRLQNKTVLFLDVGGIVI